MRTIDEVTADLSALEAEHKAIYEKEGTLVREMNEIRIADLEAGEWPREVEVKMFVADVITDMAYENLIDVEMADNIYDEIADAHVVLKISLEKDGTYVVLSMMRVGF